MSDEKFQEGPFLDAHDDVNHEQTQAAFQPEQEDAQPEHAGQPEPPSAGFVRGTEGNERLKRLKQRPGAKERVSAIRGEMRELDRIYALNVAAIRKAADYTQVEVAKQMGVTQSVVSRTERSDDMLLSTLAGYLEATGAESASIVVRVNGVDVELDLFGMRDSKLAQLRSDTDAEQQDVMLAP